MGSGDGAKGIVLRNLELLHVGVADVWGPNGRTVVDDRAANSFVCCQHGLLLLAPASASQSTKDVVPLVYFLRG